MPEAASPTRRIGRYNILSEVGRGGAGVVYKAVDPQIERTVAIKVLFNSEGDPERYWKRFQAEAKAIARLIHQNIVVLYDWGQQEEGWNYLVMQYVDGAPLSRLVETNLPVPRIVRIQRGILRALRHAHSMGVLHRDVKSSNIFLDSLTEQPLLGDFGIALTRTDQRLTTAGVVLGTPEYLAPEVCQGKTPDARSDLYSLGAVLFESLEGHPPYLGDNPLAVAYKHVHEPIPALTRTDIPAELEIVLHRALAKNPDERYQNATEMLADLDAIPTGDTKAISPLIPREEPAFTERRGGDRRHTDRRGSRATSSFTAIGWRNPIVIIGIAILAVAVLILILVLRMFLGLHLR